MAAEAEKAASTSEGTVGSEVIEVTGSLVDRKTLDTPAPVSVIDRTTMKATGLANIGDILQQLPAQSNAININFNNGGDGSTRVDLRGLGSARTLVLLNGRRVVPGGIGANASVDLNVIPMAVIERIEVLKDGASAIYGSDAIGGVVNVITRPDIKGTETTLYTGTTSHGDGAIYDASFVTGTSSSKGSVMFSAGYTQQEPVWAGDRDYSKADLGFDYDTKMTYENGSTATPSGLLVWDDGTGLTGNALYDQLQVDCPSGYCTGGANTQSGWRDFSFDGNSDTGMGDLYNYQPQNYLRTPLRRYSVFSQGKYNLSKHMRAIYEALYVNRKSDTKLAPEPLFYDIYGITISQDSIYNPFGRDIYVYRRRLLEGGDRADNFNVDTFRLVAGIEGEIPETAPALKNWKYELTYNYGRTQASDLWTGSLILSHLAAESGPSFVDGNGVATCGTPTNPGPAGCVPINVMGQATGLYKGSVTPDMLKYLQYTGLSGGFNDQKTVLAQAHGRLAKTPWDGDIALAVGADYRKEAGGFSPDPLAATGDTTTNATEPTHGSYDVSEAFAELSVVPVTNRKAAKYVEFDGAVRGYDYSTFGSGATWKVSGIYKVPQGVSVRGTYSTAFRAPGISDLYSGQSDNYNNVSDPCDTTNGPVTNPIVRANCMADGLDPDTFTDPQTQLRSKVGGNPDVKPEKANVYTAGLVIEPEPVKGLALTFDYFNIKITNAISSLGESVILNTCYAQTNRENCDLITRNPNNNAITLIKNIETNVGGNETSGLDFAASYDHDFGSPGRFRFHLEGTYLLKYNLLTAQGTIFGLGVYDLGVFPRWKSNFSTTWGKGGLGAGFNIRYIGGFKECEDDDCRRQLQADGTVAEPNQRTVDSNMTADLYASYSLKNALGTTTISGGVNNLLDQTPPFIDNGFYANSDASSYDFQGRYLYLRLQQTF